MAIQGTGRTHRELLAAFDTGADMKMRIFCVLAIAMLAGCSTDTAKRVAYETLRNVGKQQCEKNMSNECGNGQSYDDYQRQQKEVEQSPRQ